MKPPLANDGPGAVVHQGGEAVHVDAAHRRGLRDRPELAVVAAEVGRVDVDGQVRQGAPEVVQRDAGVVAVALVADVDGSVDDDVARGAAEARDRRVVADLEVQRDCPPCRRCRARTAARSAASRTGWGPAARRSRRRAPGSGSSACSGRRSRRSARGPAGPDRRTARRTLRLSARAPWRRRRRGARAGLASPGILRSKRSGGAWRSLA